MPRWPSPSRSRCARAIAALLALPLLAAAAAPPLPPPPPAPLPEPEPEPEPDPRTIHVFDFEEKDPADPDFNPDPVPRYWFRAQDDPAGGRPRPGFPAWNAAEFDLGVAASGGASVRLHAGGGSTSLRLLPGTIPVFPGADYIVTANIRTEALERSRAFVAARFLDSLRRPIAATQTRSEPIRTGGGWTAIRLEMRGDDPDAAFLQIDLELLQPREFEPGGASPLGPHAVQFDDVDASAWFDDVAVFQVPRVTLVCDAPANITVAPDRPTVRFAVRDMAGSPLDAALRVTDIDGVVVSSHDITIDPGGRVMTWVPALPGLGAYTVGLDVTHEGKRVAAAETELVWLGEVRGGPAVDTAGRGEALRFGLVADSTPGGAPVWPDFAPHVVRAARTGFIILPHADPKVDPAAIGRMLSTDKTPLDALLDQGQDVTLAFAAVPDDLALALKIDARDPLALGRHDESAWMPLLLPILDHYGQRVVRWQIGPTAGAVYAAGHPDLPTSLANFTAALARLVPGPRLTLPWRADAPPPAPATLAALDAVTLVYPHDAPASGLRAAVAPWLTPSPGARAPEVTLVFEMPPPRMMDRAALGELVKRTVEFISLLGEEREGAPAIRAAIAAPWRWSDAARPEASPGAQLAVWRTVNDYIAGRRVLTELPVVPGVRCFVLGDMQTGTLLGADGDDLRPRRGALVAWNESASPEDAVLSAYLGEGNLSLVDIFGNATPLARNTDAAGTHTIPIPGSPIIIEGVDPRMLQFLASFRITPPFARALLTEHEHALVLENPWPIRISGQLQIVSPDPDSSGWTISPRGVVAFSIAPGATEQIPISFSFRASEETGRKAFSALVKLTADRPYPAQLLSTPLDVGAEDLEFTAEAVRSDDGDGSDLIVTATIVNTGRAPRTFRVDALAPGLPSQQLPISDLAPGERALRHFVFKGEAEPLAGKRIRLSLSDADAPERLNISVLAP